MKFDCALIIQSVIVICLFTTFSCKQSNTINSQAIFQKEVVGGNLIIGTDGEQLLSYAIATRTPHDSLPDYYNRSGFIHPLKTKKGVVLTDDFPFRHTHQHALFTAWTNTTFKGIKVDFWNQADEQGTVKHTGIIETAEDNSFAAELEYIVIAEGDSTTALYEQWDMLITDRGDYYIIDWTITQRGNGTDTLILNKYHYGGTAFRGSSEWNVPNNYDSLCYFTTDEGLDHVAANHTRPLWASMYGKIGVDTAGLGIIQGKENLRYPQFIRVHPTMPYYCFTPTVEEPFSIGPNDQTISNFRLVIFDGLVDRVIMEQEMNDFNDGFSTRSYVMDAINDPESIENKGYANAYIDKERKAIAIDASKYKNQYTAAIYKFSGESGTYDLKLRALAELDGESNYRIAINGKLLDGIRTNPRIHGTKSPDYTPVFHKWKNIQLQKNDSIRIESSSETNGKIPEGDITAYSRGRFTSLRLDKTD